MVEHSFVHFVPSSLLNQELIYIIILPRNTVQQAPKTITRVKTATLSFTSFCSLRHHKQRYHTAGTTSSEEKVEMQRLADAGDDKSLEESLQSCRRFLVDFKLQKGRHSVFNFVVNNLTAQVMEEKGIAFWLN